MEHLGQFIIDHWGLWSALIIILIVIFINEARAQKNKAQELSPQSAVALINDKNGIVIDIRDQEHFRKGHIINAIQLSADGLVQQKNKYQDQALILVCAQGLQSRQLAAKLQQQGFTQPYVLAGGMGAWQQADLPIVKGK